MSDPSSDPEELGARRTPFAEVWRAFRRDRLAMAGLVVLASLLICALLGKLFTEWWVVIDPATVRLPDKLRPPFSGPSAVIGPERLPEFGVYLFGTDDLGRSVFARMLQ